MNTELCEMLTWDSTFFGFRIARVQVDTLTPASVSEIDAWSRQVGVRCLYFLSHADDPPTTRLAEMNGFHCVDIRFTLNYKFSREVPLLETNLHIRPVQIADIEILQAMARQNHRDSRFYFDANFPRHLCDLLYDTWLKRSCEGYADLVWVAESENAPVGYLSCHLHQDTQTGQIGLVGVNSQAQGQGVGRALVLRALNWFRREQMQQVTVVTQGRNIPAQRLYQRCGFLSQALQIWYHKWYPETTN